MIDFIARGMAAAAGKIEEIKVNGESLPIENKTVNIELTGKKLENNSEIFNDYVNNKTNIPNGHIDGKNNQAIIKGYKITAADADKSTVTLDSINGIQVNDTVAVFYVKESTGESKRFRGRVKTIDTATNTLTIDDAPDNEAFKDAIANGIIHASDGDVPEKPMYNCGYMIIVNGTKVEPTYELTIDNQRYITMSGMYNTGGLDTTVNGSENIVKGFHAVSYGIGNTVLGERAYSEGYYNIVSANESHAEGIKNTITTGSASHAEGRENTASGKFTHAEGFKNTVSGESGHAEGYSTKSTGTASHSEGSTTQATGTISHAEGCFTKATGNYAHSEGHATKASGIISHAEGKDSVAEGEISHAEGHQTTASGKGSHAEGYKTEASGELAHAEGCVTKAIGGHSHAEGNSTTAKGSHSHAEGRGTIANGEQQHVQGRYNVADTTSAFIIGNGKDKDNRSNAVKIDFKGNAEFAGKIKSNGIEINGDIIQNGETYKTHAEDIYTKNDIIHTREGAISSLADNEYTGIEAEKYDGEHNGQLVFDKTGTARVGDAGETQPLLTRDEADELVDGDILRWNADEQKAYGVSDVADTLPVTTSYDGIFKYANDVEIAEDLYTNTFVSIEAFTEYSEAKENKVTTISETSTDNEYPSAKAIYNSLGLTPLIKTNYVSDVPLTSGKLTRISTLVGNIKIQIEPEEERNNSFDNEWAFEVTQGDTVYSITLPVIKWGLDIAPTFNSNTTTQCRLFYVGNTLCGEWIEVGI